MNKRPTLPPRAAAQQKYASARNTLLLMAVFTVINIVLLLVESDTFFLFSASIPYYFLVETLIFGMETLGWTVVIVCIGAYLLCWFFSGKRPGFLVAALVLFVLDTAYLGYLCLNYDLWADSLLDIVFHAVVLVSLILGVLSGYQLNTLPPDPVEAPPVFPADGNPPAQQP